MKTKELSIEAMFPRIFSARHYSFFPETSKTNGRISRLYEVGMYLDDGGSVRIGENEYAIHYGDIRFVPPGVFLNSKPSYSCYTITFDFGESDTVYSNQILDNIPEYFHTNGKLRKLFEKIIESGNSNELHHKLKQPGLLIELISALFEETFFNKQYSPIVRECINYLELNYKEPVTLEKLSEISGYSTIHIIRLFRQDTGRTPHEWLTDIRIQHAKELLETTKKPLDEITFECGFRSDSHFKILFKKKTGLTPGIYRKTTDIQ